MTEGRKAEERAKAHAKAWSDEIDLHLKEEARAESFKQQCDVLLISLYLAYVRHY
jgi:hypothetical protein